MQDAMSRPVLRIALALVPLLVTAATLAEAADKLKIGLITTLSSPAATAGPEMVDGFKLGIKDSGDALGGEPVDLVIGDDQLKPDVSVQLARKMLDEDKVRIIAGMIPSNVALAVAHAVLPRKVFLLSLNAGPSQLAGAECSPYFFSVSYQNDTAAEAMAIYLQGKGKRRAALIAANYAAGRDMTTGFKRYFKGEILREIYTPLGQFDFAAELAEIRALKPDAVFYFEQSGSPSINLVRQYAEMGLKSDAPLYGVTFVLDESSLPGMGDAALGIESASYWNAALDFPAAKTFVAHFRAAYHREPTIFAATAYDGARLIDGAVRKVGGHVERAEEFRKALEAAPFESVRGPIRFNTNHFPIQNFYLAEVGHDSSGNLTNLFKGVIVKDLADSYVGDCKMK
jgi:branched-chain amino acid transport system substrate-binding protein